jgi:DedD protein
MPLMAEGSETHYQISLTGGQAFGLVLILLLGLGIAFFLGVEAGISRRTGARVTEVSSGESTASTASQAAPPETADALVTPPAPARTALGTQARATASVPAPTPTATDHEVREGFGDLPPGRTARPAPKTTGQTGGERSVSHAKPPASAHRAAPSEEYFVQIVSTSSHTEAEKLARRLKSRSYHAVIAPLEVGRKKVYRVRVGPYPSREAAERAAAHLKRDAKVSVWVVPAEK